MEREGRFSKGKEVNFDNVFPMPIACHIVISTYNRRPLFKSVNNCNNLAYLIFETTALHKYSLFVFCIMPDQVHILCQPGNILVCHFVNLLRFRYEYVLRKSGYEGNIWHPDYREHSLHDEEVVKSAIRIFEIPVRSGLANNAMDYPFSFIYGVKEYRP